MNVHTCKNILHIHNCATLGKILCAHYYILCFALKIDQQNKMLSFQTGSSPGKDDLTGEILAGGISFAGTWEKRSYCYKDIFALWLRIHHTRCNRGRRVCYVLFGRPVHILRANQHVKCVSISERGRRARTYTQMYLHPRMSSSTAFVENTLTPMHLRDGLSHEVEQHTRVTSSVWMFTRRDHVWILKCVDATDIAEQFNYANLHLLTNWLSYLGEI